MKNGYWILKSSIKEGKIELQWDNFLLSVDPDQPKPTGAKVPEWMSSVINKYYPIQHDDNTQPQTND